jgi:hypothetical protein
MTTPSVFGPQRGELFAALRQHLAPVVLTLRIGTDTATAGQGWYLIYPPLKLNVSNAAWERIKRELDKEPNGSAEVIATWWLDVKLPLNRWVKSAAYDSRRDCEETLRSVRSAARGPEGEALGGLGRALFSRATCLASDDPRLACESWNVTCVPP